MQYGNEVVSFDFQSLTAVRELRKQKNRMANGYSFRPSPIFGNTFC